MPIYEYRCADCCKKTTVVTLAVSAAVDPVCSHCGGRNMTKLVSRVAIKKSDESLADPSSLAGLDEKDPKSIARWMKKMGKEMGEDMGEGYEQEIDQAVEEAGHDGESDD